MAGGLEFKVLGSRGFGLPVLEVEGLRLLGFWAVILPRKVIRL